MASPDVRAPFFPPVSWQSSDESSMKQVTGNFTEILQPSAFDCKTSPGATLYPEDIRKTWLKQHHLHIDEKSRGLLHSKAKICMSVTSQSFRFFADENGKTDKCRPPFQVEFRQISTVIAKVNNRSLTGKLPKLDAANSC